jgi:hypothetical protein
LSGTQFSTLKSADIYDPEGPGNFNNTEVKYEGCHTALGTCCCDVYISGEK